MEHNSGGLEDDVPLQMGDFQVPAVDFPGCNDDWWDILLDICWGRPQIGWEFSLSGFDFTFWGGFSQNYEHEGP